MVSIALFEQWSPQNCTCCEAVRNRKPKSVRNNAGLGMKPVSFDGNTSPTCHMKCPAIVCTSMVVIDIRPAGTIFYHVCGSTSLVRRIIRCKSPDIRRYVAVADLFTNSLINAGLYQRRYDHKIDSHCASRLCAHP